MKRSTLVTTTTILVTAVVGALLVLTSGVSAAAVDNSIKDYAYTPTELTVNSGDTVTWTNGDKAPHTVTSSGKGPLDSPSMNTGDKWSFTFTDPGAYAYYCAIHPDMVGKVTVVAAAEEAAPPPTTTTTTPPMEHMDPDHGSTEQPPAPPSEPAKEPDESCSSTVFAAMLTPFLVHFDKAHLETSPGQQVADATNIDQYVKTHTVLIEAMYAPLVTAVLMAPVGLDAFMVHFNKAHLETSPGQQVADATNVDQYVKTHTILVENMLAPSTTSVSGTC